MSNEVEGTVAAPTGVPWYSKIFEYMRNRNRIGPGKVELPECDFFIVGPRRTLRVLLPTPKGSGYYESTANERPETIDENFVSRWAIRPHPSGNCRCSFRQSNNRFSTNEERIIRAEINRIRTSLCEAEKIGEDIEKLEKRISLNLEGAIVTDSAVVITQEVRSDVDEKLAEIANVGPPSGNKNDDDAAIKNKIVKDLEKYIEVLLQEVLNDTIKFFNDSGDTLKRSRDVLKNGNESDNVIRTQPRRKSFGADGDTSKIDREKNLDEDIGKKMFDDGPSSFDISFAFHGQENDDTKEIEKENGGYVNRAFSGSTNDPDSLDFDLRKPVNAEMTLDNLDCIDSGINSVETIEFQTSQEPSLEESLMEIIDAKFGRAPSKKSWKESRKSDEIIKDDEKMIAIEITETVAKSEKNNDKPELEVEELIEPSKKDLESMAAESWIELDDTNDHSSFDKLRLELLETRTGDEKKKNAVSSLRDKFTWKFGCGNRTNKDIDENAEKTINDDTINTSPVELRIKNDKIRHDIRVPVDEIHNEKPADIVKFRKNKKPTIVFLHGFGSSAEIFQHQLEYFTNLGYPCVAPEMLGHGMSSAPDRSRDYHFDKLVKDLEMVLEHYAFGLGRKCVLVAHNYGCSFATALAGKYDSNIHQLVLISGGGPTPLAPPSTEAAGHCCLRAMLTPLLMCGLRRDILYSARGRQHPYCGVEPPEQWPSHMKYVLDGMVWPEGDYVFHRRICTPTLLIHGLRDNKVSLVQECQMERTIIKAFLDAIPTAGHTPMTDCPDQVNHMIHCFIDLWKRKKR